MNSVAMALGKYWDFFSSGISGNFYKIERLIYEFHYTYANPPD